MPAVPGAHPPGEELPRISTLVNGEMAVPECRADDNETGYEYTAQEGLPDLVAGSEDITLPAGLYYEGSLIPVTANIKNTGSKSVSNIVVRFHNGNPSAGGVELGSTQVDQVIEPDGSANVTFTFDTMGLSGPNILYVVVDPENNIVEENETNNLALCFMEVLSPTS